MFSESLSECRDLALQAREELEGLRNAPQQDRAAKSAAAFNYLKEADENLQTLQHQARSAPVAERSKLAQEEQVLLRELQAIKKELEQSRRELLLGSEGCNTDRLFLAREERRRAAAVTSALDRGRTQLIQANREAIKCEATAVQTLQELRKQREVIIGITDKTYDLGVNLNQAASHVKQLQQKDACALM
jgi:hypothetical protein